MGAYGQGVYGAGVYGGLSAVSFTVQDSWPERVQLLATDLLLGTTVTITRRVAGETTVTPVRGAENVDGSVGTLIVTDAEAPFGVDLTYGLLVDGVEIATGSVTTGPVVGTSSVDDQRAALLLSYPPAVAGVTPVWQGGNTDNASGQVVTLAIPGPVSAGDILTVPLWVNTTDHYAMPPDATWKLKSRAWAPVASFTLEVWEKVCVGGESGSVLFTLNEAVAREGSIHRISGALAAEAPVAAALADVGAVTSPAVELYKSAKDSLLVWVGGSDTDFSNPWAPPAGFTERSDLGGHAVATAVNPGGVQAAVLDLVGGRVALTDAINSRAAEVVVLSWPEKSYGRDASLFKINGRNVAVLGPIGQPESDLDLFTETTDQLNNVMLLLVQATEGIVQIRNPGGYDGVDAYLAVLAVSVKRWSQDGSDDRRIVGLSVAETSGWASTLLAGSATFADVGAAFAVGDDFADFGAMFAGKTFLAPAVADWT